MKSAKAQALDRQLLGATRGRTRALAELALADPEIEAFQDYANEVSIRRLGFNDHGPVHMRKVAVNALHLSDLLEEAGIPLSLEAEEGGTREDSNCAILLAALLHDVGMSVGRQNHEQNSALLGLPLITRLLSAVYPGDLVTQVKLRSLAVECIQGHMAIQRVHSLEAGLILIADGCDMEKGRSRIPLLLNNEPRAGDIHQYSAAAIDRVTISRGERHPIRITVEMSESVGLFQVEEVLLQKVTMSPAKAHIELYAAVQGQEARRYLG